MSTSIEDQIRAGAKGKEQKADKPADTIRCRFTGVHYAPGQNGLEARSFDVGINIPVSYTKRKDITPIGLFRQFFARKALGTQGYSGLRLCAMTEVHGELPEDLNLVQRLMWTADHEKLVAMAQKYGKGEWTEVDQDNIPIGDHEISVLPELYPGTIDLRDAILRVRKEPKAFKAEQEKRAGSDAGERHRMERELAEANAHLLDD